MYETVPHFQAVSNAFFHLFTYARLHAEFSMRLSRTVWSSTLCCCHVPQCTSSQLSTWRAGPSLHNVDMCNWSILWLQWPHVFRSMLLQISIGKVPDNIISTERKLLVKATSFDEFYLAVLKSRLFLTIQHVDRRGMHYMSESSVYFWVASQARMWSLYVELQQDILVVHSAMLYLLSFGK